MGVKNTHRDYTLLDTTWTKCVDFMESETAVKFRAEQYLPRLAEQEDDEYLAYKYRTAVSMLAQKANKAMTGMVTRKDAYIEEADQVEELITKIDSKQQSIHIYISQLLTSFLTTGRGATLVDVPNVSPDMTVAKAEEQGVRPRWVYYCEKDILNWRVERISNVDVLTMVVLRESISEDDSGDEFSWTDSYQYRVLELKDGKYQQRLFNESEEQIGGDIIPKMKNKQLTYIPIVIHGGIEGRTPPLDQVVDLNLHHYQLSADEIHGLRMTALPTPYFFGEDPQGKNFPKFLGPTRMIGSDDPNCKIGYLEFSGAGLDKVAAKLKRYEETIAALSVQMITDAIQQTATGASIDYGSATSSLAGVVNLLSEELTVVLKILVEWGGKNPDKVALVLNKDFIPASMTPQMLQALLQAYMSATISYGTYYKALAQGEITDPHKDPQAELDEIEDSLPPGLGTMDDVGGDDNNNDNQDGDDNGGS